MSERLPTILVVEDEACLRQALAETLEEASLRVRTAAHGEAALAHLEEGGVDLVVADVQMAPVDGHALLRRVRARWPQVPVVLVTAYGTVEKAVAAMREGAADYLVKPFEPETLLRVVRRHLPPVVARAEEGLLCADPRTRELVALARRVAGTGATVLLTGESGTGKEVFARYIHACSPRREGPFVAINCAAIPENMLEAVLFGYEKGAFTGAYQATPGKFEQAQGGTLLLDEISEMGLGLQAKLLRVLQEREVERLGGRRPIALDVRVLATSNRDLRAEVAAGRFREDLFYRLHVFPLHLPPLRERPGDILPLARHLLARHAAPRPAPELSEAACAKLLAHPWPGNVRELDNVMQRALILSPGPVLGPEALSFEPPAAAPGASVAVAADPGRARGLSGDLRERERQLILEVLRAAGGNRKVAAQRLGISPRTLRYKLARLREAGVPVPGAARCA